MTKWRFYRRYSASNTATALVLGFGIGVDRTVAQGLGKRVGDVALYGGLILMLTVVFIFKKEIQDFHNFLKKSG